MKLNLSKLNSAIDSALADTTKKVAQNATDAIEANRWGWGNTTVRSDGSVVGTPRDIVDTGELKDSQKIHIDGDKATIEYTADHAQDVHADRPWLSTALKESNVAKIFADKLRGKL
jgi:hypothetical protein